MVLVASIVLNLDNGAVCGKQMLLGANSRYGAESYLTYAPHPKAFSFTEWFNVNLDIGENDAVIYARSGLHTLDFGCPENRWVYHSINDDIVHVWVGSLQHMGENTLAVVKGIAAEDEESFPRRMEEHDSSTSVSSSGLTYFTLMGGTVISVSANSATIGFTTLATVMALTMPLIVHYTKPKAESRQEQMARRATRWKQFIERWSRLCREFGMGWSWISSIHSLLLCFDVYYSACVLEVKKAEGRIFGL